MLQFMEGWNHPQVKVSACAVGLLDKVDKKPFWKKWWPQSHLHLVATGLVWFERTGGVRSGKKVNLRWAFPTASC